MKKYWILFAAALLLSGCSGHQKSEPPTEEVSGGTEGTMEYSLEGMTEPEETAVEQDTKTETRPWQAVTQPPTGETEPCVIPGLKVTEVEGYTYTYEDRTSYKKGTPFGAWKDSGEGSGVYFDMNVDSLITVEYSEVKEAEQLNDWGIGLLIDGVFVEYIDRGEGMGITLYYYGTRQPTGWSEFETHITEYGYLAIFGMEECSRIYIIFFPVNMPLENVKEFLEGIEVEPILFE